MSPWLYWPLLFGVIAAGTFAGTFAGNELAAWRKRRRDRRSVERNLERWRRDSTAAMDRMRADAYRGLTSPGIVLPDRARIEPGPIEAYRTWRQYRAVPADGGGEETR